MAPSDALRAAVDTFVDELGGRLDQICAALPDADREQLRHDVALEAFNLAAGFVGADDRLTDDELRAIIGTFGGRLDRKSVV